MAKEHHGPRSPRALNEEGGEHENEEMGKRKERSKALRRRKQDLRRKRLERSEEAADLMLSSLAQAGYGQQEIQNNMGEEWVMERLWENQRGIFLLGSRYGANALLPNDPPKWTKMDMRCADVAYSACACRNFELLADVLGAVL